MAIASNLYTKCAPAIGSNLDTCGAITACDIHRAEADELSAIFTDGEGLFRNMNSLLVADMEIKACGTKVNPWFELLMAQKRVKKATVRQHENYGQPRYEIEPFILADQQSVFNNVYWSFTNGSDPGGTPDWQIDATSPGGVPLDTRWFQSGDRVFLNGRDASGIVTRTSYVVLSSAIVGSVIRVQLEAQNSSFAPAAVVANPASGFLTIGNANVSDYDNRCAQIPGVNLNNMVEFWIEQNRWTLCTSEQHRRWFAEAAATNKYFAKFGDISVQKLNQQLGEDFQRRFVENFLWGKRLSDLQTLNTWRSLPNITTISTADLYIPGEGTCVGKRANQIGVYEQLWQCGRVIQLENETISLPAIFELLYALYRARKSFSSGDMSTIVTITDRGTRGRIQRAMIRYYDDQYEGLARLNIATNQCSQTGGLGFNYDKYCLVDPAGITWHVMSEETFDDFKSQAVASGVPNAGNMMWFLDFNGIYPAMIASNRVTNRSGTVQELAKVDANFLCTMKNLTREVTMNSIAWGTVVECPLNQLIIEGFNDEIPDHTGPSGSPYYTAYPSEP